MEEKECQLIHPAVLTAGTFFNRDFSYFNDGPLCPKMGEFSSGSHRVLQNSGYETKPESWSHPFLGPLLRQSTNEQKIILVYASHLLGGPYSVPGTVYRDFLIHSLSEPSQKLNEISAKYYPLNYTHTRKFRNI